MENSVFQSKLEEINNSLEALKRSGDKPVAIVQNIRKVNFRRVAKTARVINKTNHANKPNKDLVRKARTLPRMFGQKDMAATIKLLKQLSGVRLRTLIDDETRAAIIRDFAGGRKPRWVAEHYGIAIPTANLIRMNAGLNKRRALVS
jgi:hypothetical protein